MREKFLFAVLVCALTVSVTAQHATIVGPLTFDDQPAPLNGRAQTISVPGFQISGGFVTYRTSNPGNRFYNSGSAQFCSTCTMPLVLYTKPGARNLSIDIVDAEPLARVVDGGRTYYGRAGETITIDKSTGVTYMSYDGPARFTYIGVDNISYEPPAPDKPLTLNLDVSTNVAVPYSAPVEVTASEVTAEMALGSFFRLRLTTKSGPNAPVEELRFTHEVKSHEVKPAFTAFGDRLYREKNIISVAPATAVATDEYVAVHLGQVHLKLVPENRDFPSVELHLQIVRPAALGSEENGWDTLLTTMAHERGIPPQYVKGQVAQESPNGRNFRRVSYRYEPCAGETAIKPRLDRQPYASFKLEDARGTTLPTVTLNERNGMFIPVYENGRITSRRRLTEDDRDVSAAEIFKANDKWPIGAPGGLNWSDHCGAFRAWRRMHPQGTPIQFANEKLNFVAQTPMAASRGLFQVMYYTALDQRWVARHRTTGEESRDPYLLQDLEEHHNDWENGGSVVVGTHYVAKRAPKPADSYGSRDAYVTWVALTYQQYNLHKRGYGAEVVAHSRRYLPTQRASFP